MALVSVFVQIHRARLPSLRRPGLFLTLVWGNASSPKEFLWFALCRDKQVRDAFLQVWFIHRVHVEIINTPVRYVLGWESFHPHGSHSLSLISKVQMGLQATPE